MMFSHVHKKTSISQSQPMMKSQFVMPMQMQFKYRTQPPAVQPPVIHVVQDALPKMKWGRPVWTFFHVTAEKIKPEYFNLVVKEYLQFILLICGTLPCPICSNHASEYMRAINLNNIRSKDDLIHLFFNFHNVVNQRKGYPVLQKEQIPKYETANTIVVIKDFMRAYEDKSRSVKLMADDLARSRISSQLKNWINKNIQYFDP
jgi:hypothetical protein